MNRNRDRGIRAENEACRLLEQLLGYPTDTIVRRKNEGVALDIGDLYGVPDTCIQVTACRNNPTSIAARARSKLADCALQQARRNTLHGVVLLRIDGARWVPTIWRALCNKDQLHQLHGMASNTSGTVGELIKNPLTAGEWPPIWTQFAPNRYVATVDTWAANWLAAMRTRTIA